MFWKTISLVMGTVAPEGVTGMEPVLTGKAKVATTNVV